MECGTYFNPIWTGYTILLDGDIFSLDGSLAYLKSGGFRLPALQADHLYAWVAYE